MTDTQKERILWDFNFACEKFWKAQNNGNLHWRDEVNANVIGMSTVLERLGYKIVWDTKNEYATDIVER